MARSTNRPTSINVFGKEFKIIYKKLDHSTDGQISHKRSTIEIDDSLIGYELKHTLLHEMLHAVFYRTSLYQSVNSDLEEIIVDQVATFILENWDLNF